MILAMHNEIIFFLIYASFDRIELQYIIFLLNAITSYKLFFHVLPYYFYALKRYDILTQIVK